MSTRTSGRQHSAPRPAGAPRRALVGGSTSRTSWSKTFGQRWRRRSERGRLAGAVSSRRDRPVRRGPRRSSSPRTRSGRSSPRARRARGARSARLLRLAHHPDQLEQLLAAFFPAGSCASSHSRKGGAPVDESRLGHELVAAAGTAENGAAPAMGQRAQAMVSRSARSGGHTGPPGDRALRVSSGDRDICGGRAGRHPASAEMQRGSSWPRAAER